MARSGGRLAAGTARDYGLAVALESSELLRRLVREHEAVGEGARELELLLERGFGPSPAAGPLRELHSRLSAFIEELRHHFALQEDGFLTELVRLRPELSAASADLVHQHGDLLRAAEVFRCGLEDALAEGRPPDPELPARVRSLVAALQRHQEQEVELLTRDGARFGSQAP